METPALLLSKDLTLTVGTRTIREPAQGEIVVKVHWAGICGSDLHVLKTGDWVAYWPATLGHEVAGEVTSSAAPDFPVGTRVVLDSRVPTSKPDGTLAADRLNPDLEWLGEAYPGGYAGAVVVPAVSARKVPDGTDSADAVLAEPLAVVMCALDRVTQTPQRALVLGHGPIGALAHAEINLRWPQARVVVVEPRGVRAKLAGSMGAEVLSARDNRVFDLVVDAAGYPAALPDAIASARRGATVCLIALAHQASTVTPSDIVEKSLTIAGSNGFDDRHLDEALDRLAAAPERYRQVITHRIPLAEVPEYLARGIEDAVKIEIRCQP